MVAALRLAAEGKQPAPGPTRAALLRRGLVEWASYGRAATIRITPLGREVLRDHAE